ncbi:MAG TPA: EAL domain-containing protein [Noviherbaspirillum sp.]|jgi:diguanylate cyclase (GGDEF)-like protein|uniref:putative bifunctional diguanylate cyclase/phosphodiesterase n=1 Tax=Noviherbaspirillum sp. TaxID=1926288 RepID=UPI002F91E355
MSLRLRSLESRIVLLFLVLVLAVQLAGLFAIQAGIRDNARTAIREELLVGERVFGRVLQQYAQTLTQGARLLAADYGMREAIGSNDRETIESALANHGQRIQASHTMLIGLDRSLRAATAGGANGPLEAAALGLIDRAEEKGSAAGAAVLEERPYLVVVVPVKAPVTISWVAMAFAIGQRIADDMRELSSLQVAILTSDSKTGYSADASTLPGAATASLLQRLGQLEHASAFIPEMTLGDAEYSARLLPIAEDSDDEVLVVLLRSTSEAVARYSQLQLRLLVLTVAGIMIAFGASIVVARRITGPLRDLGDTAKRFGTGDYEGAIDVRRDDEIGELSRAFAAMRDGISKRELEIRRLAYWDTLTNLPNRAQFVTLLDAAIAEAARRGGACQVLMMDLNRFKDVNDVMGHRFGDTLLRMVAERLQAQAFPVPCKLARLGGDEFAVLLPDSPAADARQVAACLLKALEAPLVVEGQSVDLGAGIGIAGYPDHGAAAELLLSRAEIAMYAAKSGGNEAVMYESALDKGSQHSLSLLTELRRAVEENQLRLYVQPKVDFATGRVNGIESLLRWVHPDRGMVFPDQFIPFAESTGFIRTLTRWVLEQSAALCSRMRADGIHLRVSVNLSTRDLLDQELPARFAGVLARHQLPPASFCLEITESAIMDDPVRAEKTLDALHAMGADLSIDDFGTGYSSLAYLKRLPVQELKIDKSFVLKMENDADDAKIVRSTVDLGHNLGLKVVAEGVETLGAWHLLAAIGCDQGQGYFISRPIPAEQFSSWLAQWRPPSSADGAGTDGAGI